jgi:7,8-dihydropterin-6-yl-methyl-4-(beta-D-ribofuranosyl)aminobenzene 5'-phosphate synthase
LGKKSQEKTTTFGLYYSCHLERSEGTVIISIQSETVKQGRFATRAAQRFRRVVTAPAYVLKAKMADTEHRISITVTYDNNPCEQGLNTNWGFAAFIAGTEKTILFDTGPPTANSLLDNMQKLAIEPDGIDVVVLSHIHGDHTGGLGSFLEKNSNVTIYLPKSFPTKFKDNARNSGAKIIEVNPVRRKASISKGVKESEQICKNVYSTGLLGKWIKEQSLIIRTDKGLVVIIGCAHTGILNIMNTVKDPMEDDIFLVIGGFHLEWATKGRIEKIISAFKRLGVRYVGPCHCSGHKARSLFEKHFGSNYINMGAGKVITLTDLR